MNINGVPTLTKCCHIPKTILFTGRNEVVAKVIFLHLSVILFTGGEGGLPQCMLGYHPPRSRPPLGADPPSPRSRHHPLRPDPLPWEADSSIRSTSGRYASYWNAFLLSLHFQIIPQLKKPRKCTLHPSIFENTSQGIYWSTKS